MESLKWIPLLVVLLSTTPVVLSQIYRSRHFRSAFVVRPKANLVDCSSNIAPMAVASGNFAEECSWRCLSVAGCVASNYDGVNRVCELLNSSSWTTLTPRTGSIFIDLTKDPRVTRPNSCTNNNCGPAQSCAEGCGYNGFVCLCGNPIYHGPNCTDRDGEWSTWSGASSCSSSTCVMQRTRTCIHVEGNGLTCPGSSTDSIDCTPNCTRNGAWATWAAWSACESVNCTYTRSRTCAGQGGLGAPCPGSDVGVGDCTPNCTRPGSWTAWTASACSATTCLITNSRTCANQGGLGLPCPGNTTATQDCLANCTRNGAWSTWSGATACENVNCTTTRTRTCDGQGGLGAPCAGSPTSVSDCTPNCTRPGSWTAWTTSACSATTCLITHSRTCANQGGLGLPCPGNGTTTDDCLDNCTRNGQWSAWSGASACESVNCTNTRTRTCDGQGGLGAPCAGSTTSVGDCTPNCTRPGSWTAWTTSACSATTCLVTHSRTCANQGGLGLPCPGNGTETEDCLDNCTRNGQWSTWSGASACESVNCTNTRTRTCDGQGGLGLPCVGNTTSVGDCTPNCTRDGTWGAWSSNTCWNVTCLNLRTRQCTGQGGLGLPCPGSTQENGTDCTPNCTRAGVWGAWGSWAGSCLSLCRRVRTRSCTQKGGLGADCPGSGSSYDDCPSCTVPPYAGCLSISGNLADATRVSTNASTTNYESCSAFCRSMATPYAVLRSSSQCECRRVEEVSTTTGSGCTQPCGGNPQQMCGDSTSATVYSNPNGYQGCISFSTSTGLVEATGLSSLSETNCRTECRSKGYLYSLTRPTHCYCLNDPYKNTFIRKTDGTCSQTCGTELCGSGTDADAANLYQTNLIDYGLNANMGLEAGNPDYFLADTLFTASGFTASYDPKKGRLNFATNGWTTSAAGAYLEVDLEDEFNLVTGIMTQGVTSTADWTTLYSLAYMNRDTQAWITIINPFKLNATGSKDDKFDGNTDTSTIVTNRFEPVLARRFRIYPKAAVGDYSIRMELLGIRFHGMFTNCYTSSGINAVSMSMSLGNSDAHTCAGACYSNGYTTAHVRDASGNAYGCYCSTGIDAMDPSEQACAISSSKIRVPGNGKETIFAGVCRLPLTGLVANGTNYTSAGVLYNWFAPIGSSLPSPSTMFSGVLLAEYDFFVDITFSQDATKRQVVSILEATGSILATAGVSKFQLAYQEQDGIWNYVSFNGIDPMEFVMPSYTRGSSAVAHRFALPRMQLMIRLRVQVTEFITQPVFHYKLYGCRDL